MTEKVKATPKKTISIRVSVEEHGELKNISANRDMSIQSLLYPLVRDFLDSVDPAEKLPPEETEAESK